MKLRELTDKVYEGQDDNHQKDNQLNEFVDPISFGAGVGGAYLTLYSVRKINKLLRGIKNILKDPLGIKRRRAKRIQEELEDMLTRLKEAIQKRDKYLSRGDEMTVKESREVERMTNDIRQQSQDIRKYLFQSQDEAVNTFVENMDRSNYSAIIDLLGAAQKGDVTFDEVLARSDQQNKRSGESSMLQKIIGK